MMNEQPLRLKSYFGFSKIPFTKHMWATKMFDASFQRELMTASTSGWKQEGSPSSTALQGWGKALPSGASRRNWTKRRYDLFDLFNLRITPMGFLGSLSRVLGLPILYHQANLFDLRQYIPRAI